MADTGDIASLKSDLGNRIKRLRKSQGLSQEQLGLMIGLDRTYLVGVEKGRRNISFINLVKIARGLGVSLSELFVNIDPHNRDFSPNREVEYAYVKIPRADADSLPTNGNKR